MKFIPIPQFPCQPEELAAFREAVSMPGNIGAFASQQVVGGVIPAVGPVKPWRDNAAVWQSWLQSFEYTVQRGEVRLSLRSRQSDAGIVVTDAEGIGELEGVYSMQAIAFYNRRFLQSGGKEFARIPRLVRVTVDRAEAGRLSIYNPSMPVAVEWPIAIPTGDAQIPTTINPKIAFRYGPTGRVEVFNIDDYDREYPLTATGGMSDEELVGAVRFILAQNLGVEATARAIRQVSAR